MARFCNCEETGDRRCQGLGPPVVCIDRWADANPDAGAEFWTSGRVHPDAGRPDASTRTPDVRTRPPGRRTSGRVHPDAGRVHPDAGRRTSGRVHPDAGRPDASTRTPDVHPDAGRLSALWRFAQARGVTGFTRAEAGVCMGTGRTKTWELLRGCVRDGLLVASGQNHATRYQWAGCPDARLPGHLASGHSA